MTAKRVSGKELATILGLTPARISQLKTEGILLPHPSGGYDLAQAVQSYIGFVATGPGDEQVSTHRARLLFQQAKRLELANAETEGGLIAIESVEQALMNLMGVALAGITALPGRCAATVAGMDSAQAADFLRREGNAVRTVMAQRFKELAAEWHIQKDAPGPDAALLAKLTR